MVCYQTDRQETGSYHTSNHCRPLPECCVSYSTVPAPPAILVIDDDYDLRGLYGMVLGSEGYEVVMAASLAEAKAALGRPLALVISDLVLPDGLPHAVLELLSGCGLPVLLCTGALHHLDAFAEYVDGAAVAVLTKPFDIDTMLAHVQRYCPVEEWRAGEG